MRQAVILAGGQGTRLGPLTRQIPKPMLPVAGRPFLDYLIWNLSRHGVDEIVLSCGYLGEQIVDYYRGKRWGKSSIRCLIEPEPLGTGGALRFLLPVLETHFFLLNGDSLFDINYGDLALLPSMDSAIMALRHVSNASRYGRVEINAAGEVTHFLEKSPQPYPGLINAGIYWMDRRLVERLPEGISSVERDLFPMLVSEGKLFGKRYEGYFVDIGVPDDYQQAGHDLTHWKRRPAVFFDRDGVLNIDHGYVCRPEQFEWVSGAIQAIRWCNNHGYLVFVVTNQSGIARGYYSETEFYALMTWMQSELATAGAHIDAIYHCPHHPTQGVGVLRTGCCCRKPNPGMLEQALSEWDVNKEQSLLIGDNASDVEAARQVGIAGHLFSGGSLEQFLQLIIKPHSSQNDKPFRGE